MRQQQFQKRNKSQYSQVHELFNPDWQQARLHGQASKVGFPAKISLEKCPCCFNYIYKQPIPLTENTKELEVLGFGFPLYFSFIRNCIFLLVVTIFSYNLVSVYRSYVDNMQFCHDKYIKNDNKTAVKPHHPTQTQHKLYYSQVRIFSHDIDNQQFRKKQNQISSASTQQQGEQYQLDKRCTNLMVSIANVKSDVNPEQDLIRGGSIIINVLLLIYLRDKLSKLGEYFDQRNTSPSDFSILVSNLPAETGIKQKLYKKIQEQLEINKNEIHDIILIPDLQQHEKLQKKKHQIVQKLRKKKKNNQQPNQSYSKIQSQLQNIDNQLKRYLNQKLQQYKSDKLVCVHAIVIIQTEIRSKKLVQNFQSKGFSQESWSGVTMKEAPQPREIIWDNVSINDKKRRWLFVLGWGLSFLLLVVLTVVFAFVSKAKAEKVDQLIAQYNRDLDKSDYYQALFIVFGMIFSVVIINKLLVSTLFHKFTDYQRHLSTSSYQFSFCFKYCLGLFFTTALMTIIVQAFLLHNYFRQDYGVIQQQSIMFLVNSLFVPFYWMVNPSYLYRRYKQWRTFGKRHYTQQEADHIMQYPEYDVGKRYGEILEVMWFTYLYSTLVPVGAFFSVFGLFFYYWIDKYNLLRRSSLHSQVSGNLQNFTLSMLDFTIVLRNLGEVLFDIQVRGNVRPVSFVFLALSIIYQWMPITKLIAYFNPQNFNQQQTPYSIAKEQFIQNYYDFHILHSHQKADFDYIKQDQPRQKTITNPNPPNSQPLPKQPPKTLPLPSTPPLRSPPPRSPPPRSPPVNSTFPYNIDAQNAPPNYRPGTFYFTHNSQPAALYTDLLGQPGVSYKLNVSRPR